MVTRVQATDLYRCEICNKTSYSLVETSKHEKKCRKSSDVGHWTKEPPTKEGFYKVKYDDDSKGEIVYVLETVISKRLFVQTTGDRCGRQLRIWKWWWSIPETFPLLPEETL